MSRLAPVKDAGQIPAPLPDGNRARGQTRDNSDAGPVSPAMRRGLAHPFLRYPRSALAVAALLCLPLLAGLWRFEIGDEVRALLQGDRRNQAGYDQVRRLLGDSQVAVVSLESPDLFTNRGLDLIRRVSDGFLREPGVVEVKSLTHSVKPVRRGWSFDMVPLVPEGPVPPEELARLRDFCVGHPLVRNIMVSADGQHTILLVTWTSDPGRTVGEAEVEDALQRVLAPFRAEGARVRVLAVPLIAREIRATLAHDLVRFVPAAGLLVLVLLWATLRSWRLVGLALAGQAFVVALLPGLVSVCGVRLNVFSVILFPLLTALHLTLVLHLFTTYQRFLTATGNPAAAVALANRAVGGSAAFATATTIVGLLSFTLGGLPPTREFGWLAALGLALVHLFTFGPTLAVLRLLPCHEPVLRAASHSESQAASASASTTIDGSAGAEASPTVRHQPTSAAVAAREDWPERWTQFVARHRRGILGMAAVAIAASLAGWMRVRTDLRPVEFLPPASATRQALEELDRVYGGINVVKVDFDTGLTNGVNRLEFLRTLERVRHFAESRPNLSAAHAYSQVLALMNNIWEQERPGSLRLPDSDLLVGVFVLALRSYELPFLDALVDPDFQRASIVLRTQDLPAAQYLALVREVEAFAASACPPGVTVSAAEGLRSILEADRLLVRSQANSAVLTAVAIGLLLAGLWRSWRLAGIALAANAVPVAMVFAVAGYAGLPLNSVTVMVAALALGIAIDNSIHFLTHWLGERRRGLDPSAAVAAAVRARGRAILGSTGLLVAVFSLFAGASFPPVMHFGLLSALAFVGSLVAVGVLLPALLAGLTPSPRPFAPEQRQGQPDDGKPDLPRPREGFVVAPHPDQQAERG